MTVNVTQANGECAGEEGMYTNNVTLDHNLQSGIVMITGIFGDAERTIEAILEDNVLSYDETYGEDGGFTHSVVTMTVDSGGTSMSGTEDWDWGPAMNSVTCPNSKSQVTAVKSVSIEPGEAHVSQPIRSFLDPFRRMMGKSEAGRRLLRIVYQYETEIFTIFAQNPAIGGEAIELASKLAGSNSSLFAVEFGGGELFETYETLRPGVSAALEGEGAGIQLSQGVVDQIKLLRDLIVAEASPGLQAELEAESFRMEQLDLVNKSFDEAISSIGVDPQEIDVLVYDPTINEDAFSVKLSRIEGFQYELWKNESLAPEDWVLVENATKIEDGYTITLLDPNAGKTKLFYRVQQLAIDQTIAN